MSRSPRAIVLLFGLSFLFSFAGSLSAQQVVFSRRVYAPRGRTYQQLWVWSASDGHLTQLTQSAREHRNPACTKDGSHIFFTTDEDRKSTRLNSSHLVISY